MREMRTRGEHIALKSTNLRISVFEAQAPVSVMLETVWLVSAGSNLPLVVAILS